MKGTETATGNHGPVLAKKPTKDISQEPEMVELKRIYHDMTEEEKQRTLEELNSGDVPE